MPDEAAAFTYAYYEAALDRALAGGYTFASFARAGELADSGGPVCLLRHDCDNDLAAARRMAEIEGKRGIRATYFVMLRSSMYNSLAESDAACIRQIMSFGHEIGLHFDAGLVGDCSDRELRDEVAFECGILERYFGQLIEVVSFHRPSTRILSNEIDLGRINTYSKATLGRYQYMSDSSYLMRVDLPKAMGTAFFRRLHLNLHPEWWDLGSGDVTDRWKQILSSGVRERQDDLWAREDAFLQRFEVTLAPAGARRELPASRYYQRYEIP